MEDGEILLALGRLEGKVDALIATSKIMNENLTSHDQRIRELEGSKSMLIGVCSVVAIIVSLLTTHLGSQ